MSYDWKWYNRSMKITLTDEIKRRFQERIHPEENGCWTWTGSRDVYGYGRLHYTEDGKRGSVKAHRLSWLIHCGDIPENMIICHRCDTPSCVNPAHLFLGTWQDNMTDRDAKLRHFHGSAVNTSKLTEDQVREIYRRYSGGENNLSALGRAFDVSHTVVRLIITGGTWRHLHLPPLELTHSPRGRRRR